MENAKAMMGEGNIYPTPYATLPMGAAVAEVSGPLSIRLDALAAGLSRRVLAA